MWRQDARYFAWLMILLASALLLPFLYSAHKHAPPGFAWSPGYWEVLPEIGLARIVPFSGANLVNPAAGAGPSAIRAPANNKLAPKY